MVGGLTAPVKRGPRLTARPGVSTLPPAFRCPGLPPDAASDKRR